MCVYEYAHMYKHMYEHVNDGWTFSGQTSYIFFFTYILFFSAILEHDQAVLAATEPMFFT